MEKNPKEKKRHPFALSDFNERENSLIFRTSNLIV